MMRADVHPRVMFPKGFDERAELEMSDKGWIQAAVELPGGYVYQLRFVDKANLQYDVDAEFRSGRPYFGEAALAVVPAVTVAYVRQAANELWRSGFFEDLLPLCIATGADSAYGQGEDTDPAIAQYEALRPDRFRSLSRLEVRQNQGPREEYSIEVDLRALEPGDESHLYLVFSGALNLGLLPTTRMLVEGMRLRVGSVRDRGWGPSITQ